MSLIEYHEGRTFLHEMDPRVKVILLLILTVAVFMTTDFLVLTGTFLVVVLLWKGANLPIKKVLTYAKFLLGLVAFLTFLQAVFVQGEIVLIEPIIPAAVPVIGGWGKVYLDGILYGLLLGFRLLIVICLMPMVVMTTPVHILSLGLVRMGLSYQVSYMFTTALNLIPTLQSETQTIIDAQKMRGLTAFEKGSLAEKFKAYPPLVVPLVIGAMRKAQLMGVAMDSRAFGASKKRTYMENIEMKSKDYVYLVVGTIFTVAIVVANFII